MAQPFDVRRNTDRVWHMERFHFHNEYEILYSLTDNGEFFLKDRRYRLSKGSLLLLPPGELHRSVADENRVYDRWVAHFPAAFAERLSTEATDLLAAFRSDTPCRMLSPAQEDRLQSLFTACAVRPKGYGDDLLILWSFVRLLIEINRMPQGGQGIDLPPESSLAPILRHIREHPQDDLSLTALSARFYISRSQLCRKFRAETGFSPNEYIVRSRVMRACALLDAGVSAQDAGSQAGFGDQSHFIRTFHTLVGEPPGRYAKSRRDNRNEYKNGGLLPPVKG